MDKKKKLIILIALTLVLLLIVLFVFLLKFDNGDKKKEVLKVKYVRGEEVNIKKLSKEYTKEVIVENTGDELEAYTFEWYDIENNVKDQNNFTYEIKGEGDRAPSLGRSQVPIIGSTIFTSVAIQPGVTQKYTLTFKYTGKDVKKHSFNGKLRVKSLYVNEEPKEEKEKVKEHKHEHEKDHAEPVKEA